MNHFRFIAAAGMCMLATTALATDFCTAQSTPIPDNAGAVSIPLIFVGQANEIVDTISVELLMSHDWVGDLVIKLQSPNGTMITLLDRAGIPSTGFPGPFGCGGRDLDCTFTDQTLVPAESVCSTTAVPVIAGEVIPSMPMDAFTGEPASGLWFLLVSDESTYDTGTVHEVCLSITTNIACPPDLNADGVLDFFDISAFLTAFAQQDPIADFSDDGLFDFFDISAFLTAFSTGCP